MIKIHLLNFNIQASKYQYMYIIWENFSSLGMLIRNRNGTHSLFSQEFKQSGAVGIVDLSSYNPILKPERSAV